MSTPAGRTTAMAATTGPTVHAPASDLDRPHRGIHHLLHPQVLGVIIGASGASAFVHVNRVLLPDPWPALAVAAWALALALCAWAVLLRRRRLRDLEPPGRFAGLVYTGSVLGMLAAFAVGRVALDAAGRPELMPGVVVLAVGLHFVPFASAFDAPVFGVLGWTLAGLGVLGLALGWVVGAEAVAAAAVLTGVAMLALMAVDALRPAPAPR
ncbi:hypothetical protein KC207_04410 [Phycicoccus sp. BSK3Z-2]|uniref:Uncharacterized protein n=1 Tax=Phycicoccus avicenniae TaxID=2828860 RepID=A0A941D811_9MICO|nr:hypothetical protein [Phycicoccus avicenniae]MBR7742530.1 hypothetical protein [Phycicoccus avicenniae]